DQAEVPNETPVLPLHPEGCDIPAIDVQVRITSSRCSPISSQPIYPSSRGVAQRAFALTSGSVILLHMASANATTAELLRVVGMPHVVDVPDNLALAHLAGEARLLQVCNLYAIPSFLGHTRSAPFSMIPSVFASIGGHCPTPA